MLLPRNEEGISILLFNYIFQVKKMVRSMVCIDFVLPLKQQYLEVF